MDVHSFRGDRLRGRFNGLKRNALKRTATVLLVAATALGVAVALPTAASSTQARSAAASPTATAARLIAVQLHSTLRLVGRPGHVDYVKGTVSGTLSGTTTSRYVSAGLNVGEATFVIYPKSGGSLSGRSVTRGRAAGPVAYFSGTVTITSGTGPWAHARGHGLSLSGTMNRQNYHSTTVISGTISV